MKLKTFIPLVASAVFLLSPISLRAQGDEDELYTTAQRAFNDGFHDVAVKYLEEFLPKYPQSSRIAQAKLLLGQCYYLKNNFTKALDFFKEISSLREDKDALLFWMGETYLKLADYDKARQSYSQLLDEYPSSVFAPQALYSKGWSYFDQKAFPQSKVIFDQLLERFPKHQLAEDASLKSAQGVYNGGDYALAAVLFEQYLMRYPQSVPAGDVYLNIADSYYYMDDFNQALLAYDKAIKLNQDLILAQTAFIGKIWTLIKKKSYDQAEKIIKDSIEFSKQKNLNTEELYLVVGQLMFEKGDLSAAVNAYSDFIRNFPAGGRRLEAYLGRGNVYYLQKKYADAVNDFKFVINHAQINAGKELVQKAALGLGWASIKNNQIEEGVKSFLDVIANASSDDSKASVMLQLADAYQDAERFNEAVGAYDEIVLKYPGIVLADYLQYRKAIALLKSDQIEGAINAFAFLKNNFPDSKYLEDIGYYLGVLEFKKGNWSAAAGYMEEFLKSLTRPSDFAPEANYILALSMLNLKQPDEALKIFQKILRLYPDEETVAKNADIGIAKCQFETGQVKEAVKRFKLIVYKYPKSDVEQEALLWLAQNAMKNAQYDEAIDFYNQIIERFPLDARIDQVHYELGQAYELQGASEQALSQYKKVGSADAVLVSKVKLAIAGIFSKEFDPQKAIEAYENIAQTNPEYARDAYLKMSQLYRNSLNYDAEVGLYEKAIKADQGKSGVTTAELYFNLGDVSELNNRMEEAVDYYLKIPAQFPDQVAWVVKAYLRVAKIFEDSKDWEGARVTYQKIIQLKTDESKYAQERLDLMKKK